MPENEENRIPQSGEQQSGTETQTTEGAPETEVSSPTNRDNVLARLRERNPELGLDDDNAVFEAISNYMNEDGDRIDKYKESAKRLMDTIDKDRLAGDLFVAMAHGENPIVFLVRKWGPDITEWLQTDEGAQAFQKASQEFNAKQEQKGKDDEQWTANVNASIERLDAFAKSHGLDEERQTEVFNKLWNLGQKFLDGNYDDEDFELALKALNYDGDVSAAREEGNIEGRNSRIAERVRRSEPERSMPTSMAGGVENPEEAPEENITDDERLARDPFGAMRYSNRRK